MSESSRPALLDGGKAVGICAAIGAMIGFVAREGLPLEAVAFTLMLLPFLPVPVALFTARHGATAGIVAGLVIGSLCTTWTVLSGTTLGLLVFMFAAVGGVFAGIGFRNGVSIYRMLVMSMVLFLGMLLIWFGAFAFNSGTGPLETIEDMAADFADQTGGFYEAIGVVQGSPEEITSDLREGALLSTPAWVVIVSGLMAIIMVSVSRLAFRTMKQAFPGDIRFSELRLHFGFVYLFIGSLAFLLAAYILDGSPAEWSEGIGQNLMLVSSALFFIQGLAIASWFLRRRKASGAMKAGVYFSLGLLEGFFSLVSFVGIFDVFMDFRKRYGEKGEDQQNTKQ